MRKVKKNQMNENHQVTKYRFGYIRTLQLCNNSPIYLFVYQGKCTNFFVKKSIIISKIIRWISLFVFKEDEYHYYFDNNLICQNNLLTWLYDTWWSFNGVLDFVSHGGQEKS